MGWVGGERSWMDYTWHHGIHTGTYTCFRPISPLSWIAFEDIHMDMRYINSFPLPFKWSRLTTATSNVTCVAIDHCLEINWAAVAWTIDWASVKFSFRRVIVHYYTNKERLLEISNAMIISIDGTPHWHCHLTSRLLYYAGIFALHNLHCSLRTDVICSRRLLVLQQCCRYASVILFVFVAGRPLRPRPIRPRPPIKPRGQGTSFN